MPERKCLYVVIRADLPEGLAAAQGCHVAREFTRQKPAADVGDTLVLLEAESELHLAALAELAHDRPIVSVEFREVDLGGQLTAVAFDGAARRLLSSLPKAFKAPDELAA